MSNPHSARENHTANIGEETSIVMSEDYEKASTTTRGFNVMHTKFDTVTYCDKNFHVQSGSNTALHGSNSKLNDVADVPCKTAASLNKKTQNGSVESLQQRQCELQIQLDEVMVMSKVLETKQKCKLSTILSDKFNSNNTNSQSVGTYPDDDDDELIEFQQIETELRISELKRQLSNIQEEIRLRLYKRLLSKTTNGKLKDHQTLASPSANIMLNSIKTLDPTPPSSSCSEEHNTTTTSEVINSDQKVNLEPGSIGELEQYQISKAIDDFAAQNIKLTDTELNSMAKPQSNKCPESNANTRNPPNQYEINDLKPASNDYIYKGSHQSSTNSKNDSVDHKENPDAFARNSAHGCISRRQNATPMQNSPSSDIVTLGSRAYPANNDLERIEEGEEEDVEYYANSNVYRSIYEEKISPIIKAGLQDKKRHEDNNRSFSSMDSSDMSLKKSSCASQGSFRSPTPNKDIQFSMSNVNSAKRGNRPLTLYMPRPDEDIDLLELVQSLGHDLNIISCDLKLDSTSACGYLHKLCSSNSKKWLKRYFYFDRSAKTLSYYETEEQLVKKSNVPNCIIPFDDISDVYVDHRMSDLSEKHRNSKKKSFVFILATTKRKYLLSTMRAETMRAWIDILFTAAKANDYFKQIEQESFLDYLDPPQ